MLKNLLLSVLLTLPLQSGLAADSARLPELLAQDASQLAVKPSQAAVIAQDAYPGSKVLGVKLLPSGQYAVTLKIGGSVQKVLVNATTGAIG